MSPHYHHRFKSQILGLAVSLGCFAWAASGSTSVDITFKGDSTLHGFDGWVSGQMTEEVLPDGSAVLAVTVPVLEMKTGHDGRDKKMYTMFNAGEFGVISGWADKSAVLDAPAGEDTVVVHLSIHGRDRDVTTKRVVMDSGSAPGKVRLEFDLSLKDFGLVPPSVIGLIRVSDKVRVMAEWPIESPSGEEAQ